MHKIEINICVPNKPHHFGFLLVDNFALIPYASVIETLRMANQVSGEKLYSWETLSIDGNPVSARCGLEISPKESNVDITNYSTFLVCGGTRVKQAWTPVLGRLLNQLDGKKTNLGALSTGSYLLAKAGVLNGYRCTVHWDSLASMREEYPRLLLTDSIYEIDRNRYTCAGGTTAIDMMLHIIAGDYGREMAVVISENLLHERMRCMSDRQRIPLLHQIGTGKPKITETVQLMEMNLEEPLSMEELAKYMEISRRQLERLFKEYLSCSPREYYNRIRLYNARRLLMQTNKSILDISILNGFKSAAHFSQSYKKVFGVQPRMDRCLLSVWDKGDGKINKSD